MAVEQCNTTPIEIIRADCGTYTIYEGTKEQLIAAGFADESFFPDGRKRVQYSGGPYSVSSHWWSVKKIKGGRFKLRKQHAYSPIPQPKDKKYSCPAIFKDRAIYFVDLLLFGAMNNLSGQAEFLEYGETTIWLDEQSMQDVLCAGARLVETIRAAKVVRKNKASHLSIVK